MGGARLEEKGRGSNITEVLPATMSGRAISKLRYRSDGIA